MKKALLILASIFFVFDVFADSSPPTINFIYPANNTFAGTSNIPLVATAVDADGISHVDFYEGNSATPFATVASSFNGYYFFSWSNVAPGTHTITAKATDSTGATSTSGVLTITVFSYVGDMAASGTNATYPMPVTATFANLTALQNDTNSCNGKVVYLQGFANAGDGGQGWLYGVAQKASTPDGVVLINSAQCGFKRFHSNDLNIKLAGAKGNGVDDDTVPIQKVLDTKFNVVGNAATDTYLVSTSSKVSPVPYKAALILYSGQKLDLKGSTLKLADGANSSVLMNESMYFYNGATLTPAAAPPTFPIDCTDDGINDGLDDCIVIRNGTIDGNVAHQQLTGLLNHLPQFEPTVYLGAIKRSALVDLTVKNFWGSAIFFGGPDNTHLNTDITLNNIVVRDGVGVAVAVNGNRYKSNSIDISGAQSFSDGGLPIYPWGVSPNSITIAANDNEFGLIRADNCGWGFKLQDGSINNHFSKIWVSGTTVQQAVKFQGSYSTSRVAYNDNTRVDEIISENNQQNGLYIYAQKGLQITSYTGNNNGLGWAPTSNAMDYRDIAIIQSNVSIATANINSPKMAALDSRVPFPAGDTTPNSRVFGTINVTNPSSNDSMFDIRGSYNTVDKITITAIAPLATYIAYEYGALPQDGVADLNSYFGVRTLDSNQPRASGIPFQVPVGQVGHTFLHVDCVRLGTSATWQLANDTSLLPATAACPL